MISGFPWLGHWKNVCLAVGLLSMSLFAVFPESVWGLLARDAESTRDTGFTNSIGMRFVVSRRGRIPADSRGFRFQKPWWENSNTCEAAIPMNGRPTRS
jgi:hypothetical protein